MIPTLPRILLARYVDSPTPYSQLAETKWLEIFWFHSTDVFWTQILFLFDLAFACFELCSLGCSLFCCSTQLLYARALLLFVHFFYFPFFTKQQHKKAKFCVFERTWITSAAYMGDSFTLALLVFISTIKYISVKIIESFTSTAYLHFGDIRSLINICISLKFSPF